MNTFRRSPVLLMALALAATVLAPARAYSAGKADQARDPAQLEKEGKKRLEADLARAGKLRRPEWLGATPLEVELTANYNKMRRAVDSRFGEAKSRAAVKILYELIDRGTGKPREWAGWYIAQSLVWAKQTPFAMLEYSKARPTAHSLLSLGRCYLEYDQFKTATSYFERAAALAASEKQKNVLQARAYWGIGDVCRRRGDGSKAKAAYQMALNAFGLEMQVQGKPGWYYANVRKNTSRMQFLMDLCDAESLDVSTLKPGTYTATVQGFDGPITVNVTIADGKMTNIKVTAHKESIPLDCFEEIPRRIIENQTPSVDTITGATVTAVSVMGAVLKALQQAR
ncbi:MAG: FMN-binding protein [Planctomycetes bacterium]|nr:FMN-binding protein [Planctomycetota bacterium]